MNDKLNQAREENPTTNPFHVPLKKHELKRIMGMRVDLDKSYGSIFRYTKTGQWPADLCLEIQRQTNGDITATRLNKEAFADMPQIRALANTVIDHINRGESEALCIELMNTIESMDSVAYSDMIENLTLTDEGERVVNLRLAHRSFGSK